ncbi:hypothetical protein EGW08_023446, partial [Elysia chlorotica]
FKDSVNNKTNLSNRGVVVGSDLDGASLLFNDRDETAVNFTAGINIAKYYSNGNIDFDKLAGAVRMVVDALNKAIDVSEYPTAEARRSALEMRPIGIGLFNLSGLFAAARLPFACLEAQNIGAYLCEFIYYHALNRSAELAKIHGPYSKCGGSDFSKGLFQQDYDGDKFENDGLWKEIECNVKCKCYGTRNSQVTSQISSSSACVLGAFDPQEGCDLFFDHKRDRAGFKRSVDRHIVEMLKERGVEWNSKTEIAFEKFGEKFMDFGEIGDKMLEGSSDAFRTIWSVCEMSLMRMARRRGAFIDQGHFHNAYL